MNTSFGEIEEEKYRQVLEVEFAMIGINSKLEKLKIPFRLLPQIKDTSVVENEMERYFYLDWCFKKIVMDAKLRSSYSSLYEEYAKNHLTEDVSQLIKNVADKELINLNIEDKKSFNNFIQSKDCLHQFQ